MVNMKIAIGFVTYNDHSLKYLQYFLPTLKLAIKDLDVEVLVFDNSDNDAGQNRLLVEQYFPAAKIISEQKNLGFTRAYNILIDWALLLQAEYFLMVNPDILLDELAIVNLLNTFAVSPKVGAVCPKILQWDFAKNLKTNIIDSCGVMMTRTWRFFDIYQGEADRELKLGKVFGFTGAAVMLNLEALKDTVLLDKQYLDEAMFMYKEDVDLSWRLQLAGWEIIFNPQALIYHDRTVALIDKGIMGTISNRSQKDFKIRLWSFINQQIIYQRYRAYYNSVSGKLYHLLGLVWVLIFEPKVFVSGLKLWSKWRELKLKKNGLKVRISLENVKNIIEASTPIDYL